MGSEWLNEICQALEDAGIPAGSGFPGSERKEIGEAVAAVGLRDLDYASGEAVFEIRLVSPRVLGGWHCQSKAAVAVAVLEKKAIRCGMEPMGFDSRRDCFEVLIRGRWLVLESGVSVKIGLEPVEGVVEFTAELNRDRQVIEAAWGRMPLGVAQGKQVWNIRLVQAVRRNGTVYGMPEEPFAMMVMEEGLWTIYQSCYWNRVERRMEQGRTTLVWQGIAMERKEPEFVEVQ